MDGRFGRCGGCEEIKVFCGGCASVGARCASCSGERRRALHRVANRAYGKSPLGRASGRERQARFRAVDRERVTDAISTEGSPAASSSSPPSSAMEAARTEEVFSNEPSVPTSDRRIAVVRCACCGRVLSGRVQPSERSPRLRRRPRIPRVAPVL